MTNCKFCGKQTENNYCSNECMTNWIKSDDFDKEMVEYLGLFNDDWYKLQIKQNKQKIKLYSESCQDLETQLIYRIGQDKFNEFLKELETTSNEEGDNI